MNTWLLLVVTTSVLLLRFPSCAEWVEIPQLKPSSPAFASISSTTTIKPATINGHVLTHTHLLLSHLSDERERPGGRWWSSPGDGISSSGSSISSSPVRWQRPVSDLLDYNSPSKRVAQQGGPAWFTTTTTTTANRQDDVQHHHTHGALVNVTSKVEQLHESSEEDDQYPVVQTELLPFGNRYEEESIETASGAPKAILYPMPAQHYDDFDDYDERPQVQMEQNQPNSGEEEVEQTEYVEDAPEPHGETEEDEEEEVAVEQEPEPPRKLHLRPQPPTGLGGFLDFLRRMQASFVQRTAHTIGDKIRTLAGMRDQLLRTIERRISALWRGVPPHPGQRRVKRGWMEPHADTEAMDFPSAEGALLTISFLTFAVFLIKLVLQVINTIKAKHYTYSTFAAATPVSGGLLVKRTRRHTLEPHELHAILGALDGFRPA